MFSSKETSDFLSARDYHAFLTNRGLLNSSNSRLLFIKEAFNNDQTFHAIVSDSLEANPNNEQQATPPDSTPLKDTATEETTSSNPRQCESLLEPLIAETSLSPKMLPAMRAYLPETTAKQPTRTRAKFDLSQVLDTLGSDQLIAARETVDSLHFPTEQLQKACGNNIRHFEISYHATLGAVYGFLNRALSHDVDMSFPDGKLEILSQYKSKPAPLTAEDRQILESVETAWKRFMKACCALALAEAAWQTAAGPESSGDVTDEGLAVAGSSALINSTPDPPVNTETASKDEAEVSPDFLDKVEGQIARLEELSTRGALYLSGREWET
ncbi:uncharacterized protein EKO05_0007106 [Ascochyta rabiei]|uniref:Uncharacterized protein n=1 Tax=Didymella rabiei TaxID=5454 RepID=A0A163G3J5_DIDRA|nr:uncharacterized protein EKO05_0007106 [Ascochyta rabiei]KZM24661.1 hypothetical protein ST47_g4148 [Ascochyta rabiei]UPX16718.1 hypothetical protein EKO05_0007106 [Ascochyta rabiei]